MVLVVEDSEDNQTLLSHYLRAMGLDVDIAGDGLEGLAKAEKDIYDLVVMDIQMPGMDGHATAQALRAKGFSKPIIALTAHAFKEDRDKAMASGFNDYLTKPINRTLLMQALTKRLKMPSDLH
ncbi:MAG TPA: response regulator [Bdellovibrionales bacterium]|nr:response regulator [Bdellovibrionales bacterium]